MSPDYAEFGMASNFSFLRGASQPEELVVAAELHGYHAVGLADRNTVAGVVRAWQQARTGKIRYHPGARLVFSDGTPDVVAYPRDRAGWAHLCRLLTLGNLREESVKGSCTLFYEDLLEWAGSMSMIVLPSLRDQDDGPAETMLRDLSSHFPGAVWLGAAPLYAGEDPYRLAKAAWLADRTGTAFIATGDVLYHDPARRPLQDILTAIRLKTEVATAGHALEANAERHMKPKTEIARLYRHHHEALRETLRFAETLHFSLGELKHNYPDEPTRNGATPQQELERLAWEGAAWRFPAGISPEHSRRIRHELDIIEELGYARYFLTVHDVVRFAQKKGILCQGRGSAANSLVCYCIGVTAVGPEVTDTLFERFISRERNEPPDIDIDFEHERRDEIIEYIYGKYSEKRTALAAAVISYRSRSATREVAKALGLSDDLVTALSSATWRWSSNGLGEKEASAAGLDMTSPTVRLLFENANAIHGFPRHLSQHVGGFVITRDRLDEIVPIMKTAMPERKMVEWDKDDLDSVGLLKIDILALGMLSCLRRALDLLEHHYPEARDPFGRRYDLATIPAEDARVYEMICRADTLGVFQIESRAQMTMLPRLRPRVFYDLVIEVAIVRPGPIQGNMVHPYLRRRQGKEKTVYPHPEMERILGKTLGVPLFQEQAMRIAIEAGGFSPEKADKLRRAMATFRRVGTIGTLRQEMIDGMVSRGYDRDFAERCFSQIEGFGEYGFPESHAASFALLVYASCWFKAFYPDIFCAAILNAQPMGFYAPSQLVRDAREHGVDVRAVDVNHSYWDCTLEEARFDPAGISPRHRAMRGVIRSRHAVRLGLRQVKGLSEAEMAQLVERRQAGYASVRDLWLRSNLSVATLRKLAAADAFRSMGLDRRAALWAVRGLDERSSADRLPLFDQPGLELRDAEPSVPLPDMPAGEHVIHDYRALSLSLKAHPVSFLRERLDADRTLRAIDLERKWSGSPVMVAGLVLVRQRPGSAKGVIFETIEDETGVANIIVWPKVFEQFRPIVLGARFVRVHGKLQSESGVIHVVAERIEDLTPWLSALSEEAGDIGGLANADEVRRPVSEGRDRLGARNAKLARLLQDAPSLRQDLDRLSRAAGSVMPKGRNFQ